MKRRSFIQSSSALSLPFLVGNMPFTAVGKNKLFNLIGEENDKVLVLVQLQGGNDGLTTLIPIDQYDQLAQVRSNVLVPESSILKISDTIGFHPSMQSMQEVWDAGQLNIIQSVAYPNQNRSHFRSTDIWHTASEPDEFLTTGWMGRYFDLNYNSYPEGYPNSDCPDPFALTIGTIVSETCQGTFSNFSLTLTDPYNPGTVNIGEQGEAPNNCFGRELTYVREIARQTNAYSEVISGAANSGNNLSNKYPQQNNLAEKLKIVARLISGGLQTKIYVVQIGGFDLHSEQVVNGDPTQGNQTQLLNQLSDAICAFQDDCTKLGIAERVVGMTYSEFGRRIRSNESFGTDHGTAAPVLVFGSCVNPEIVGDNPEIDNQVGVQEGVPMQYDFRSVYATIMMDWFEIPEEQVREVLFEDFQRLPIIAGCNSVSNENVEDSPLQLDLFPNPAHGFVKLQLELNSSNVRIDLFDARGSLIKNISNKSIGKGSHEITIATQHLPAGSYFVRVTDADNQVTRKFVKM